MIIQNDSVVLCQLTVQDWRGSLICCYSTNNLHEKLSQSGDCINLRPIHIYTHNFLHLIFYHIIGSLNCKVAKKNGSAASPGEPHDNLPGTPCTNGRVWAGFQHQFCKIHTWVIHICNIMLSIRCRLALLLTVE